MWVGSRADRNLDTTTSDCFFQAEDGIRYLVRSRGLGDVYKRQVQTDTEEKFIKNGQQLVFQTLNEISKKAGLWRGVYNGCLLYTSDAADERSSVDLGGRRIIKKKKKKKKRCAGHQEHTKNKQIHRSIIVREVQG